MATLKVSSTQYGDPMWFTDSLNGYEQGKGIFIPLEVACRFNETHIEMVKAMVEMFSTFETMARLDSAANYRRAAFPRDRIFNLKKEAIHAALNDIQEIRGNNPLGYNTVLLDTMEADFNQELARRKAGIPHEDDVKDLRGYVYVFVAQNGYSKIGLSRSPHGRLRAITMSASPIVKVMFIKTTNMNVTESSLHIALQSKRSHGEWFRLTDDDMETLEKLSDVKFDDVTTTKDVNKWLAKQNIWSWEDNVPLWPGHDVPPIQEGKAPRKAVIKKPKLTPKTLKTVTCHYCHHDVLEVDYQLHIKFCGARLAVRS